MNYDGNAVARELNIELRAVRAEIERTLKRKQRVFGIPRGKPAVRDCLDQMNAFFRMMQCAAVQNRKKYKTTRYFGVLRLRGLGLGLGAAAGGGVAGGSGAAGRPVPRFGFFRSGALCGGSSSSSYTDGSRPLC